MLPQHHSQARTVSGKCPQLRGQAPQGAASALSAVHWAPEYCLARTAGPPPHVVQWRQMHTL